MGGTVLERNGIILCLFIVLVVLLIYYCTKKGLQNIIKYYQGILIVSVCVFSFFFNNLIVAELMKDCKIACLMLHQHECQWHAEKVEREIVIFQSCQRYSPEKPVMPLHNLQIIVNRIMSAIMSIKRNIVYNDDHLYVVV